MTTKAKGNGEAVVKDDLQPLRVETINHGRMVALMNHELHKLTEEQLGALTRPSMRKSKWKLTAVVELSFDENDVPQVNYAVRPTLPKVPGPLQDVDYETGSAHVLTRGPKPIQGALPLFEED